MLKWCLFGLTMVMMMSCSDESGKSLDTAKQEADNSLMRVISGTVWYRERIALPPGAEVKVYLEDQSKMDAPAQRITEYTHIVDGSGPYKYRLVYNPRAIQEKMRYGLRARIEYDGKLIFTSTEHIDPFASEPGTEIEIMVSKVGRSAE
ncbi:lipo-like protein [Aestuariicella hydrocarbonica]|uniref:Lipo-like protein n=1 Tax=Pseudomaricurvus hydrocarbonicus TaxID=1470433 RepID=A0A9E5MP85_9GAMM|nr:YbaY family lipoprotein [Aestuariicella hydrocarbonica]NHO67822.1 lipo-like protein [Aestuariicella hydrocarbonica]